MKSVSLLGLLVVLCDLGFGVDDGKPPNVDSVVFASESGSKQIHYKEVASTPAMGTDVAYCSFFDNRGPRPQYNLKNCTWYRENSCCLQLEIENIFGKVKPLRGASPDCVQQMNFLMCYICAPTQHVFYSRKGYLRVCEEFCDKLFSACGGAVLKGVRIRDLYSNGTAFCQSRNFEVIPKVSGRCFYFEPEVTVGVASRLVVHPLSLLITVFLVTSS